MCLELPHSRGEGARGVIYQLPSVIHIGLLSVGGESARYSDGGSWNLGWHELKGYREDPKVSATFSFFIFKMGQ